MKEEGNASFKNGQPMDPVQPVSRITWGYAKSSAYQRVCLMLDKTKDSPEGLCTEQEMSMMSTCLHFIGPLCSVRWLRDIVRAFGVIQRGLFCDDAFGKNMLNQAPPGTEILVLDK